MENLNTTRLASYGLLLILSGVILFHIFVLSGLIPFAIVWGGRLQDTSQMLVFETISIAINLVMLAVAAIQAGMLKVKIRPGLIRTALWVMFALFLVNTLGNLFSNNELEKMLFTPLTGLLALFCLRLATSKTPALAN
jgi:hypothetical protein